MQLKYELCEQAYISKRGGRTLDRPEWTRMDPDGPGWTRADKDGPGRTRTDQDSERPRQTWGSHGFQTVLPARLRS